MCIIISPHLLPKTWKLTVCKWNSMVYNWSTPFEAVSTSTVSIVWTFMVFCSRLLLKIESSEYCGTGKCTAVGTTPKKYRHIPVYWYFCTPLDYSPGVQNGPPQGSLVLYRLIYLIYGECRWSLNMSHNGQLTLELCALNAEFFPCISIHAIRCGLKSVR